MCLLPWNGTRLDCEYLLGYKLTGIKSFLFRKYGQCSHDGRPDIRAEIHSWRIFEIERKVLEFCGGVAAEWVLTGIKQWDYESWDYRHSVELLTPICEDEEEIAAYIELMLVGAKNLLNKDRDWKAVKELATALVWLTDNDGNQARSKEDLPPEHVECGRGLREMARGGS